MKHQLPSEIATVRRDLSDWVWHFTRRDGQEMQTLLAILASGHIRGGRDKFCRNSAICLTEMPLLEAVRQSPTLNRYAYARFSDYGLGFRKSWIFGKGGMPVIYQPEAMRAELPSKTQWRHCELDYAKGIDFTWQREWRVPGTRLDFSKDDEVIVVMRTEFEAFESLCENFEVDHERDEFFYDIRWPYVTHERLANAKMPRDVEVVMAGRDSY